MNCLYFACADDLSYTDAGYRWAHWLLEATEVVKLDNTVDVDMVLNWSEYWNPPPDEQSDWLCKEILPMVRRFLIEHCKCRVEFVDEFRIYEDEEKGIVWREFGT